MSDLVKREDAMRVAMWFGRSKEQYPTPFIKKRVMEIPTADRPRGEWIDQHENGHGFWVGTCNQCGKENRVDNFCPNCGAMMKGADDDTD